MKLYNTIAIFDVFVVAETPEAARKALLDWIYNSNEPLKPNEMTALETRSEGNIREAWRDQKPLCADDVSDKDFEKHVQGHTTLDIFNHIYTKR